MDILKELEAIQRKYYKSPMNYKHINDVNIFFGVDSALYYR